MIAQTPWFERKFEFHFPAGLFPVIVERLRGAVPRIEAMVKDQPEEKLSRKKDGKWSVKEVVGHLYDLEELWYGRVEDFMEGKEVLRAADLTNKKTHEAGHQRKSIRELIDQFSTARRNLINKVEPADEEMAGRTSLHPRLQQPMRMIDSLFFVAEHDDHHIAQMRALLIS
ncbi:MAG TPA: DinB family protein [Chitinophagaceae bacterium]|nr:DinB family protein [Chitinophagaceae bacterium]